MKTKIAIASDHAGYEYKKVLKLHLEAKGFQIEDFGTHSTDSVDYPDFVKPAANSVANGNNNIGIIVGGSGNEAIVANRFKGVRCAVVWNEQTARLAKEHGDCNMIAIGQRFMSQEQAVFFVEVWLGAEFKNGRHQLRISKIDM
jgi:ribose 5-phosphate isomerase B